MNTTVSSAQQLLDGLSPANKDKDAIIQPAIDGGEENVSFAKFYKLVGRFQSFYKSIGVKNGDRIVMTGPNRAELAASIIAAWRLAVMAIPVDFRMTSQELANVFTKVQAKTLFISNRFQDANRLLELLDSASERTGSSSRSQLFTLETIAKEEPNDSGPIEVQPVSFDFPALIILTSGTTGTPKGAVHDFKSLLENLTELAQVADLTSDVVALLPLPISHIFGLEVLSCCIMYGATIVFCEMEPSKFLGAINKHRPHILSGVPLMYGSLLSSSIPANKVDLSRTRILLSGGAPLPVSLAKNFEAKFGKRINNGYGSTESKIIALNLDGPVESIGRPVPSVKVHIIDGEGNPLPEGSEGEIVIDSPHLMKEYFGQPEKTREVITDKGYRTGDIGYVKDGYIYISGREKDMIVVAGNKVFPSEVEEVLLRNPLVLEVAVTGPEHRRLGQIVKATIVVKDQELSKKLEAGATEIRGAKDDAGTGTGQGSAAAKEAREEILKNLKQFCQENLKRELRPMEWDLRPISQLLPKTRSGKIDKKSLE